MGTAAFQQGSKIEIDGKTFSLQRKVTDQLWQVEDARTKRIVEFSDEQLREYYCRGKLRFVNEHLSHLECATSSGAITYRDIPPEAWEVAKVRRAYVSAVLDMPSTKAAVTPIIREVWQKLGTQAKAPGATTVLRWKSAYLAAGSDIHALLDQSNKKGNRSSRYPKAVEELVERAIEAAYLTRERKTVQDTLDKAAYLVMAENKALPDAMRLPPPTRRLVERVISRIPAFDRAAARYGKTAAIKRYRGVLGHRVTEAPLERVEMDHTKLDLFVVDDHSGIPLGRPWVTACIDDYTRCILGIYVGFEPPSYLTVAKCLKHALVPKVDLKREYSNIKNDWDAHGVMRELVVDNGMEFHSASLENACFSLGIELHYAPRKTPWFKGKIERFFGTLNSGVAHGNPGTTFSNIFEKDDYDPSKHALVSLSKLQEIIRMWIVDYYHQKPHRTLQQPPAEQWKNSIALEDIQVPDDPARLDVILGRIETRTLTHKGIELDGLLYNSPELVTLRQRLGERLKVELRIDDTDLGHITVFSPDKKQTFKARAAAFNYAQGLTRWQHRIFKRYAADRLSQYDCAGWIEAKETISRLVQDELIVGKQRTRARVARFINEGKGMPASPISDVITQDATGQASTPSSDDSTLPPEPAPSSSNDKKDGVSTSPAAPLRKRFKPLYRQRMRHTDFDEEEK